MAIGLSRAGYLGALAAWTAFTLPSAVALVLFAYSLSTFGNVLGFGWLHGLKAAAVAVVAVAVLGMARSLAPDRERASVAVVAAIVALAAPMAFGQVGAIVLGGIAGLIFLRGPVHDDHGSLPLSVTRRQAIIALAIFFALLIGLPLLAAGTTSHSIKLFDSFYRAGSLVFGGGMLFCLFFRRQSCHLVGWITTRSSRATEPRKLCPAHCSPSRPISEWSCSQPQTDGSAAYCA
jgi:chromate transporter